MEFVVIDVETANPNLASVCQVGLASFGDGREVHAESFLIDPEDYFSPINVSIHGIDIDRVLGAPCFAESYPRIAKALSEKVVVSHTAFDRAALARACAANQLAPIGCRWLDSASVARRAWPTYSRSGYGLANLAAAFGFTFQHHDALEDARAAGQIMLCAMADTGLGLDDWFARCRKPLCGTEERIKREGHGDGPLHPLEPAARDRAELGRGLEPRVVVPALQPGSGRQVRPHPHAAAAATPSHAQ
jgi:DNA polymerase-3 subunit epsilon